MKLSTCSRHNQTSIEQVYTLNQRLTLFIQFDWLLKLRLLSSIHHTQNQAAQQDRIFSMTFYEFVFCVWTKESNLQEVCLSCLVYQGPGRTRAWEWGGGGELQPPTFLKIAKSY